MEESTGNSAKVAGAKAKAPQKARGRPRKRSPGQILAAAELLGLGGVVVGQDLVQWKNRRVLRVSLFYDDGILGRRHDEIQTDWLDLPQQRETTVIRLLRERKDQPFREPGSVVHPCSDIPLAFAPVFHTTVRLAQEVVRLSRDHAHRDVDRILRLTRGTAQRIGKAVWPQVSALYRPVLSDHRLAMDGLKPLSGLHHTNIMVPLAGGPLVDVLKFHDRNTILDWLRGTEGASEIAIFVIDPSDMLRDVIREFNPEATIIVDRRHMCHLCHRILDAVRSALRIRRKMVGSGQRRLDNLKEALPKPFGELTEDQLDLLIEVFAAYPRLGAAWWVAQDFCRIYEATSRRAAEAGFRKWCQAIPPDVYPYFENLVTRIETSGGKGWREEFFAYFDYSPRLTTAVVESTNASLKAICTRARGQGTFDRLRAAALCHPTYGPIPPVVLAEATEAIARGADLGTIAWRN